MSATTNIVSTITPFAAVGLAQATPMPPEWTVAVSLLAGVAVLLALISNGTNIWRNTRRVPPIETQIKVSIDELEGRITRYIDDLRRDVEKQLHITDKRLDAHAGNIRVLETTAARLQERTDKHRRTP